MVQLMNATPLLERTQFQTAFRYSQFVDWNLSGLTADPQLEPVLEKRLHIGPFIMSSVAPPSAFATIE